MNHECQDPEPILGARERVLAVANGGKLPEPYPGLVVGPPPAGLPVPVKEHPERNGVRGHDRRRDRVGPLGSGPDDQENVERLLEKLDTLRATPEDDLEKSCFFDTAQNHPKRRIRQPHTARGVAFTHFS